MCEYSVPRKELESLLVDICNCKSRLPLTCGISFILNVIRGYKYHKDDQHRCSSHIVEEKKHHMLSTISP